MSNQNVVIIGGVAGGMSAAARLRRLDENLSITVLERGPYVSFANCGLPYYLGGEITDTKDLLLQTPESLRAAFNLDVRVGHEAIELDAAAKRVRVRADGAEYDLAYDHLILSPGAKAVRPPIDGLNSPRVHTLRTVDDAVALRHLVDTGASRAVVLGAGFIGLEAAEALRSRGLAVAIVELAPHVLPPLENEIAHPVQDELARLGIDVHAGVAAERLTDQADSVLVHLSDGTAVAADLVVLSVGVAPDTAFAGAAGIATENGAIVVDQHGRTNLPDVYAAGDATVSTDPVTGVRRPVALAAPANRAGRLIADAIASSAARPMPKPQGTAIVRVGELAAAMTGANRAGLERAGRAFTTVHVHPLHHAGYFPGAKPMHLVVHFDPATGELLGGQGVGAQGVDKRIDVLATAMRGGLGISDLMDLDLSYSPPYGSARDPITMVGLVAENVMSGQITLWQPEELDWALSEAVLVLDVRSAVEFAGGHLPGAMNVPHTEIRGRLDEVRQAAAGRPLAVMCHAGIRSYIAYRILVQAGFAAKSLSGGLVTLRHYLGSAAESVLVKVGGAD